MMKIQVFISSPEPSRAQNLAQLFDTKLFEVEMISISSPSRIVRSNFDLEAYRVLEVLKKSDPDRSCLYLKDNNVSNSSKKAISRITKAILKKSNWDLAYYTYWLDRCDLYGRNGFIPYQIPSTSSYLVKTSSPNGIQALMFSPHGKKIILGKEKMKNGQYLVINSSLSNSLRIAIEKGYISALAVVPTVFEFNQLLSKSVSDLAKSCACRRPNKTGNTTTKQSGLLAELNPIFWFIGIVFLVILILWSLYYLGRRPSNKKCDTSKSK